MDIKTLILSIRAAIRQPVADFVDALDAHYGGDLNNKEYEDLRHGIAKDLNDNLMNMGSTLDPDDRLVKLTGLDVGRQAAVGRFDANIRMLKDDTVLPDATKQPLVDALERAVTLVNAYCAEAGKVRQNPR